MAPVLFWFRRDLRLSDHPALVAAAEHAQDDGVLPVFIADDELLGPSGPTRVRFVSATLGALEQEIGAPLCLRAGNPAEVLVRLCEEHGVTQVYCTRDHAPYGRRRDEEVKRALQASGIAFVEVSSNYAVAPGTVTSDKQLPLKVFTAFRRRWETYGPHLVLGPAQVSWASAESELAIDDLVHRAGTRRPELFGDLPDEATDELPKAGEHAALELLEGFAASRVHDYKAQRDLLSVAGTSSLSPHLHVGSVHPRSILAAVPGSDEGSATYRSEICWREFYADVLFHEPRSVSQSLQRNLAGLRWDSGPQAEERFRTWARGETGIPLVDAAMRQLLATGWMHNRGRMLVASFLVKHLHLDWRWGAKWFMWRLVDGDVASNAHGWQWTAGTGTDAAPFHRIFSPVAQAERFDPDGTYIHRWVPELAHIPAPGVLQPGGGVDLLHPSSYPAPMIDLKVERAEALARFQEARAAAQATP